ncbi:MAG: polymer-forming cytoskeletal protein [Acidobacteriota bacterium]
MFGSSDSRGDLNGFLDAGSHIKGELHFEDTFRIEGKLTGSVESEGELVVGERGDVDGDIKARRVFVSGTVRGTLRALERLEISPTGKVLADLYTPVLKMEEGAILEGKCHMQKGTLEAGAPSEAADPDNVARLSVAKS